jgi:transglutaminase-like putative cysteine protease
LQVTEPNQPIRSISREVANRSCVFAVCFCFLFSIAPHFPNLPLWVSGMVAFALSWRCLQELGKLPEVPKWILIPLVILGGVGVFAEYWTVVGRDAGLALLTVMSSFKFLESRRQRDLLILVFLCYFLIATHFLFSQSIATAAMMFVTLIVITATLITINQREQQVRVGEVLQTGSRLVLYSIPLMLILFVLVPRIPGPLWGLTNEQRGGITGLSDNMSPGKISNLIRSNDVAFRVEFEGDVPPQSQLYWRGPVMADYNGYRWSQAQREPMRKLTLSVSEPAIKYTVTLEPNGEQWLLALDVPTRLVPDSLMTSDFQLISKTKINDLQRYSTESRLAYEFGINESEKYLQITSRYPDQLNPKTTQLGRSLAARFDTSEEIVNEVLAMFSRESFFYTLKPPLLGENVVDEFLFESRRGFCEHYAGSFALLMRTAGIPARIVTGYQGGEFNDVGNYLIVRQSDAHAWTEVWIEGRGWIRVDPTAAVSPDRIESGLDDALDDEVSSFRIRNRNPIFGKLMFNWDNMQHGWNDWVLNYDDQKQRNFLSELDLGIKNWSDMVIALVMMLVVVTGSYWLITWYRELPPRPAAYEILFKRLLRKLARHGMVKKPAEDTRAFLRRISTQEIAQTDQLERIIDLYNRIKYGRNGDSPQALKQMRSMINSLQP